MQLIEVLFDRPREELDVNVIQKYNDVCHYLSVKPSRRQYYSGHKELEHTAPLLKFSLEKEMRRIELEVVDRLLFASFISGIDSIIIDEKKVTQLPAHADVPLRGDELLFCNTVGTTLPYLALDWNGTKCNLHFSTYRSAYPSCYFSHATLPNDTSLKGVYVIHSVKSDRVVFKAYTKRLEMYENLYDRNWVVSPGIPPQPLKANITHQIDDAFVAIGACKEMRRDSPYRKTLLQKLKNFDRNYRWRGSEHFKSQLKELIAK